MSSSSKFYILTIGLLLSQMLGACAKPQPQPQPSKPASEPNNSGILPRVSLPGSEVRQIESSNTGRSYDIYIRLPSGVVQNQSKKYPVLYVLDGQWDYKLLDSIHGGLFYDGFIPELIIVGITYSGENVDYESLRAMDYTPFHDLSIQDAGGAPKFLAFIKEELFPLIEANYPVDPARRVLMGHSFGGAFTLYAMFTEPELFSGYVAGSPSVVYGNNYAFSQEAEYAQEHDDLPTRLYLFVGGSERLKEPVEEFMQILGDRDYPGFEMETLTLEGEGHSSVKPEGYNRGLRYIFQGD